MTYPNTILIFVELFSCDLMVTSDKESFYDLLFIPSSCTMAFFWKVNFDDFVNI